MDEVNLKQAIDDISAIRRVLEKSDSPGSHDKQGVRVNILLQFCAFFAAFGILIIELVFEQPNRAAFLYSSLDHNFMRYGLINTAIILLMGCICMFSFIIQAAKNENKAITPFIAKNFSYLKKMTFFSDLLMKFIVLSLIIYAGKPEWVSVIFTLFTADYLFQGRFFKLPLKLELALALLCMVAAIIQFVYGISSLIPSLSIFSFVALLSLINSAKDLKTTVTE